MQGKTPWHWRLILDVAAPHQARLIYRAPVPRTRHEIQGQASAHGRGSQVQLLFDLPERAARREPAPADSFIGHGKHVLALMIEDCEKMWKIKSGVGVRGFLDFSKAKCWQDWPGYFDFIEYSS
ncbi:hypothetical protein WN48_04624 [Eufriesea mexicana]|uniref:Uncharacterized protein n=1 Tax=Eufriesea mexicana TaxID=516756 RepID=A0A310SG66_9HYME|nr:hypothetical protein WN48_04624 [Eufriesea mexicana]